MSNMKLRASFLEKRTGGKQVSTDEPCGSNALKSEETDNQKQEQISLLQQEYIAFLKGFQAGREVLDELNLLRTSKILHVEPEQHSKQDKTRQITLDDQHQEIAEP